MEIGTTEYRRMDVARLQAILDRVSYKPGWRFRAYEHEHDGLSVLIFTTVPDAFRPGETELRIHSPFPPVDDESDVVRWLLWRLKRIEVHEVCEFLRLDGMVVTSPHSDTAAMRLVEVEARLSCGLVDG